MPDDPKPPASRTGSGTRRAARAYRKVRRLAAKAGDPANQLNPTRRRRAGATANAPSGAAQTRQPAAEPDAGAEPRPRQRGAVKTGFLFGFGFAAGTAVFRLIVILLFYGALAAFGYWAYSRYVAGVGL